MWSEKDGGRGANQIASCIFELIKTKEYGDIERLVFYSDACGSQNRNSHVMAMFIVALENLESLRNVNTIDHRFMISGHSRLECDTDHSSIEKQKKKLEFSVEVPNDWFNLVKTVGGKKKFRVNEMVYSNFLNFSDLLTPDLTVPKKDLDGNSFEWTDIHWLRYSKSSPRTVMFKCTLNEHDPFRSFSVVKT